ncbi:major capsid protein [Capybara microvirus Cap1_SP_223]|nr:major capsid protein [Capybara microvirus Cap1_SP_223]
MSRFVSTPTIGHSRSRFDLSHGVKTSATVGYLYPNMCLEVLPGDTFKVDDTFVCRVASSFLRCPMDNLVIDQYFFFVPNRLVSRWEEIMGENKSGPYAPTTVVTAPVTGTPFDCSVKTIPHYMGVSAGTVPAGLNVMPFRAFALIYDQWFRDQNFISPMQVETGDWIVSECPNNNAWSPGNYMGKPPKVGKMHDIFTSCLPMPQKGPAVGVNSDITTGSSLHNVGTIKFGNNDSNVSGYLGLSNGQLKANSSSFSPVYNISSTNLETSDITVTDIRYAFQLQRILERANRSGSRYREQLFSIWNVQAPDSRIQIPEYLGGRRMPLSIQQVAQTQRGEGDTALGSIGSFSLSTGKNGFTKSFVEHGYIIGCYCIRQQAHVYQQGLQRMFFRKNRYDFYDPALAHISEQPIFANEIQMKVSSEAQYVDSRIFGYNEAWAHYRQQQSFVSGDMSSQSQTSYDIWHFGDWYDSDSDVTLGQDFIEETPVNVDRTLAVPSTSADQFLLDFWHGVDAVRVMPEYSVPGLVDHG